MSTRTKKVVTEEEIPVDEKAPPSEEEKSLDNFLETFGPDSGLRCRIRRYSRNGNMAFIATVPISECTEEFIQEQYGGGRFQIQVIDNKGKYRGARSLEIEDTATNEPAVPVAVGGGDDDPRFGMLMQQMANQQEMMIKLIEANKPVPQEKTGVADIVQAIVAMKELQPKEDNKWDQFMTMLTKGIEIGANGGAPDKSWTDTAKDVLGSLPGAIALLKGGGGGAPPPTDPQAQLIAEFQKVIKFLKPKAIAGKEISLYVDIVMDNIEDPKYQAFLGFLQYPYEEIAKVDQDLLLPQYRGWFEQLFNSIKNAILEHQQSAAVQSEQIPDTNVAPGPEGDASGPATDGAVSP